MEQLATLDHQVQLRAIAVALERICRVNRDLRSSAPTVFDAVAVPAMSIHCYLVRLHRYTKFDFVCFHVAAWYLAKLCQTPEGSAYCPTLHNIHRLLIAALLVASKATDDVFHANVFMAQCGGIGVGELNKLEIDLCERLNWKLLPSVSELRELIEALPNPQASFWAPWYNARCVAAPTEGEGSAAAVPVAGGGRLPPAKSVADSLGRFFRGAGSTAGGASDSNLQALAEKAASQRLEHEAAQQQHVAQAAPTQTQTQQPMRPPASSSSSSSSSGGGAGMPTAPPHPPQQTWAGAKAGGGAAVAADGSISDEGSPRSVVQRTFSLSNLFGLASW